VIWTRPQEPWGQYVRERRRHAAYRHWVVSSLFLSTVLSILTTGVFVALTRLLLT
jgi:hypothetical protein